MDEPEEGQKMRKEIKFPTAGDLHETMNAGLDQPEPLFHVDSF
jgi:hypothetical protein